MFVTPTGPVLGTAEMLNPVSWTSSLSVSLDSIGDDQRRLQESIQSSFGQVSKDQEWIDKYRAALDQQSRPAGGFSARPWRLFTLALLSLGSAIYLFSIFNILNFHLR